MTINRPTNGVPTMRQGIEGHLIIPILILSLLSVDAYSNNRNISKSIKISGLEACSLFQKSENALTMSGINNRILIVKLHDDSEIIIRDKQFVAAPKAAISFARQSRRLERRPCHPDRGEGNPNGKGVIGQQWGLKEAIGSKMYVTQVT